jgi:hypothetical protein
MRESVAKPTVGPLDGSASAEQAPPDAETLARVGRLP